MKTNDTLKYRMGTHQLFLLMLTLILTAGLTVIACEGPAGPQGEQGLQGEEGPQGPKGEEGTANVIYSDWIPANWNITNTPTSKAMFIEEPHITEEFQNTGTVMVYAREQGGSIVIALPYTSYTLSIGFGLGSNTDIAILRISAEQQDGTINPPPLPAWVSDLEFRYVLIPGGVALSTSGNTLDLMNYGEVARWFNIKD